MIGSICIPAFPLRLFDIDATKRDVLVDRRKFASFSPLPSVWFAGAQRERMATNGENALLISMVPV